MTDKTTARDRAIEIVNETIGFDRSAVEADMLASEIVAGLLARPEVLRALVGAPTADVAEPVASNVRGAVDWLLYFYAEPSHQGEDDQTTAAYWALGDDLAGKLIDAFRELARLRAAAPAREIPAGELAEALDNARYASELDENTLYETVRVLAAGVRERQETFATELARGMRHPRLVICPARVHSSFPIDSDDMVSCPWCPDDEPDGMDLEAQGEMADQLAAAQEELAELRALIRTATQSSSRDERVQALGELAVRALDGDTTEEK